MRQRTRHFAVLAVVIAGSAHAATLQKPEYLGPRPPKQVRRVVTLAPSQATA